MAVRYPSIPNPTADVTALRSSGIAMKETLEILTQQRGNPLMSAVTWQDLVDLGLILPTQVPTGIGQ
jgi:hypothetical protein